MNGNATPLCSVCCDTLGKYGGPVTLPCGESVSESVSGHISPQPALSLATLEQQADLALLEDFFCLTAGVCCRTQWVFAVYGNCAPQ